mmetsp:Transcript_12053/g.36176  ORF Transcript_12053/g.36176 Transcript_12053/m.36176 type:complete len:215 (+) Transcript_12053:190-834(+)
MHSLGTKPHTHNRKARSTSRIVSDNVFALAFPIGRMMKLYESPQQQDELINPGQLGVWLVVLDSLMVILPKLSTIWDWDRELGGATWGGFAKVAGWDSLSHDEVMVTSGLNACPRRRRNVTVSSLRTRSGAANRAFLPCESVRFLTFKQAPRLLVQAVSGQIQVRQQKCTTRGMLMQSMMAASAYRNQTRMGQTGRRVQYMSEGACAEFGRRTE